MRNSILSLLILIQTPFISYAQEGIQDGFQMLENGDFKTAESFFRDYLTEDPENKTALICYGRAVGLNGKPEQANRQFNELLEKYPADLEIELNYNESLLWAGRYTQARPLYAELANRYPDEFEVLLGFANTLSNLKEYPEALFWIDKALKLDPANTSALTSKKYILLASADKEIKLQNYKRGEQLLESIFEFYPNDPEALRDLANCFLLGSKFEAARSIYKQYAEITGDSLTALNGIALAYHLDGNNKIALDTARVSFSMLTPDSGASVREQTSSRYIQALIWNRKFVRASQTIDSIYTQYSDSNWLLALRATLGLYTGRVKNSLADYSRILQSDSTSFDGNLGRANALYASNQIIPAYHAARRTLIYYPNQKDALAFIEKLDLALAPRLTELVAYTIDNGNNQAFYTNTSAQLALSERWTTHVTYDYRTTENTLNGLKAETESVSAGLQYQIGPKTALKSLFGLSNARFSENAFTQPLFQLQLQSKPFNLQDLTLGYQREIQNFNAELISREIVQEHYQLTYNLGSNFGLGWYSQVIHTRQSDSNQRDLLFTSLYQVLLQKPLLKFGLNYQYMTFKEQLPELYFSPSQFQAGEIFGDFRGKIGPFTSFVLSAATGKQQIEDQAFSSSFRAEAGIQFSLSKRLSATCFGKYSNIASATAAGFEFAETGIKLQWLLSKQPVFATKTY
ncbi:tetratricopeptide repeat protein [Robiginitalea sp. IMCC43444]|uniref:tetratricopeptide repeat protein n=1 Tax=Robiginitalea sp. IMCC43444 TaxID=3459121 RepID=UPI004042EB6E